MIKLELALINAIFLLWGFSFNLWFQWKTEENLLFKKDDKFLKSMRVT